MIETHPFGVFVPPKAKYLILGSFTGQDVGDQAYDWFYCTKRNQFWPIIEEVYGIRLETKSKKQRLFTRLGVAIGDIILSCERRKNGNLDVNLTKIVINKTAIERVLGNNKIETIFFTSRFVERLFKGHFKFEKLVTLPSPSPRYATMSRLEKVKIYKRLLPKLKCC